MACERYITCMMFVVGKRVRDRRENSSAGNKDVDGNIV